MFSFKAVTILIITLHLSISAPINVQEALEYFERFGFTAGKNVSELSQQEIEMAFKTFQETYKLPVTGHLNNETIEQIAKPRCGKLNNEMDDLSPESEKWKKTNLTFHLKNYPRKNLDKHTALKEIQKAFDIWTEQVPLNFIYTENSTADIQIEFVPPNHGDGPYKIVAIAYFPENGGAFFDDEDWTANSDEGINLFMIAAHEFGHLIGLEHSSEEDAIMYEFPPYYDPNYQLHRDDRVRIKALYGLANSWCDSGNIDAIFATSMHTFYVIKDGFCWKYYDRRLESNYPKHITEEWPGVPVFLDEAYYDNGKIHFVEKHNTWIYENGHVQKMDRLLTMEIDAVTTMGNRLYFFKDSNYWRYNTSPKGIMPQNGFPTAISSFWTGVPSKLDAVFYDEDRYIYFFKGKSVYTFDSYNKNNAATTLDLKEWMVCKKI
ncbi:Matrix metalloproteinase 1 [Carabus blaptoides fortunei]